MWAAILRLSEDDEIDWSVKYFKQQFLPLSRNCTLNTSLNVWNDPGIPYDKLQSGAKCVETIDLTEGELCY